MPRKLAPLAAAVTLAAALAACQPGGQPDPIPAADDPPGESTPTEAPPATGQGAAEAAAAATPTLDPQQLRLTVARPSGLATATAAPSEAGTPAPGALPAYTGGDTNDTARVELMGVGESRMARIDSVFEAHNWLFEGRAGQAVSISVIGSGGADPSARLLDPDGALLVYQQDVLGEANLNVQIDHTLPADGLYTVRVDLWIPGEYTITIRP